MQREIERLNDQAVGSARALRTGETRTVGVLVPAAASVLLGGLASGTHSCRSMSVERVLRRAARRGWSGRASSADGAPDSAAFWAERARRTRLDAGGTSVRSIRFAPCKALAPSKLSRPSAKSSASAR